MCACVCSVYVYVCAVAYKYMVLHYLSVDMYKVSLRSVKEEDTTVYSSQVRQFVVCACVLVFVCVCVFGV